MVRNGEDPSLPVDYSGYVLLFNEPNNPEPYGHPIAPADAVVIFTQLREKYSNARFVVGNVNIYSRRWMIDFWRLCRITPGCELPEYLGFHIYVSDDQEVYNLHKYLDGMYQYEYPNTKWWITEFADVTGNVSRDEAMVREFKSRDWIERWAYFTNRASGKEPWYPADWNVQLIDWYSGELTNIGEWYAHGFHRSILPLVSK
jgi:hypothetical protein